MPLKIADHRNSSIATSQAMTLRELLRVVCSSAVRASRDIKVSLEAACRTDFWPAADNLARPIHDRAPQAFDGDRF